MLRNYVIFYVNAIFKSYFTVHFKHCNLCLKVDIIHTYAIIF